MNNQITRQPINRSTDQQDDRLTDKPINSTKIVNRLLSYWVNRSQKGFSVVEVMLAVALFMVFATGLIGAILGGMDNNRLAGEQTIANQYAAEGLEAVRSIRNQAYTNLVNTNGTGIVQASNVWTFAGVNNVFDKYTRVLTVSDVLRDSNGNIVASGGTLDPNTKKIVSTVSWDFTSARANSVVLTTYLTNWRPSGGGGPATCSEHCVSLGGYSQGTCRKGISLCNANGEINENGGNKFCTQAEGGSCCCLPGATPTPGPTATPTPTPTPTPANCNQHCQATYGTSGSCVKSNNCSTHNEGRIYECNPPNICCCQ